MARTRTHRFDNDIIECFQFGMNPGKTYRYINRYWILSDKKPIISRRTIERMYNIWISEGKQGEKTLISIERSSDGKVIGTFKDKTEQTWTRVIE